MLRLQKRFTCFFLNNCLRRLSINVVIAVKSTIFCTFLRFSLYDVITMKIVDWVIFLLRSLMKLVAYCVTRIWHMLGVLILFYVSTLVSKSVRANMTFVAFTTFMTFATLVPLCDPYDFYDFYDVREYQALETHSHKHTLENTHIHAHSHIYIHAQAHSRTTHTTH